MWRVKLNSANYGHELYYERNDDKAVRAEEWKGNSAFL